MRAVRSVRGLLKSPLAGSAIAEAKKSPVLEPAVTPTRTTDSPDAGTWKSVVHSSVSEPGPVRAGSVASAPVAVPER